jgi:hypothetical protein
MGQFILVNFITIISMEKEFTHGQIIENMKENGEQIRCTGKEPSHGQMVENILENMLMIRKKDMENLIGLMEDAIVESGLMVNNTEKVLMLQVQDKKNMGNGKMEKG